VTIPPPPEAVREYFNRRRRARDPDKGFSLEEMGFNDALWRGICVGKPVPPEYDPTPANSREAVPEKLPASASQDGQGTPVTPADGSLDAAPGVTPKSASASTAPIDRKEVGPECVSQPAPAAQGCVSSAADGLANAPPRVTPKIAEPRPCATCRRPFRPWRPQDAYCSSPCRQKAYRGRLAGAGSAAIRPSASKVSAVNQRQQRTAFEADTSRSA
jgi:hypothetical protein